MSNKPRAGSGTSKTTHPSTPQIHALQATPTSAKTTRASSQAPSSPAQPAEIEADLEIDDSALAREYAPPDTVDEDGTSLAERVFGALDSGGLEDEDQDEDEDELDLGKDGR